MNRLYIFFFLFLNTLFSFGQEVGRSPQLILANEFNSVTLFFPSSIVKVIDASVNYEFTYEKGTNIGILNAKKGSPSNLTIITKNGFIYSFTLDYSLDIKKYNFVLETSNAIGKSNYVSPIKKEENITPSKKIFKEKEQEAKKSKKRNKGKKGSNKKKENNINSYPEEKNDFYEEDRIEYYKIFAENNYLQPTIFKRNFRTNKKIVLKLKNVLVDRQEMYFVLQIENNSKKDYLVNALTFFIKNEKLGEEKKQVPLYKFNLQDSIEPSTVNEVVYVFKKTDIKKNESIVVVLDESKGDRMVILPLSSKQINSKRR